MIIALQIMILCSCIFTLHYGMFALLTGCCLLNLFHVSANISKFNSTVSFMLVITYIYAGYYSYIMYDQMKEQYNEQHSVAYKTYYHYIQKKVLHGREYINSEHEKLKVLGLFNPRAEIEERQQLLLAK